MLGNLIYFHFRSIVDVNDFSNINPVETDDKNVAYEEINVSGDSVMEVEPDVNEEQSIEAIQELIKSSQRIDGKKYVPEIPEKSESLSIHKTSSKHDLGKHYISVSLYKSNRIFVFVCVFVANR